MPFIRRPSFSSDCSVVVINTKKKKKKKGGLFGWLCGSSKKKTPIISIRNVTEPPYRTLRRRPSCSSLRTTVTIDPNYDNYDSDGPSQVTICVICRSPHTYICISAFPRDRGCCRCAGYDGYPLCSLQRRHRRHRRSVHRGGYGYPHTYESSSSSSSLEMSPFFLSRSFTYRSRSRRISHYPAYRYPSSSRYWPPRYGSPPLPDPYYGPEDYSSWDRRLRGSQYLNSVEHSWREELIDLMAENREESSWERHNGCDAPMPDFEKGDFAIKDPQERQDRIEHLRGLLEDRRQTGIETDGLRMLPY